MSCNNKHEYSVYEYDGAGIAHLTDKIFTLEEPPFGDRVIRSNDVVLKFFRFMFNTINQTSGFTADCDGLYKCPDVINIRWRTPHWKLVKVK